MYNIIRAPIFSVEQKRRMAYVRISSIKFECFSFADHSKEIIQIKGNHAKLNSILNKFSSKGGNKIDLKSSKSKTTIHHLNISFTIILTYMYKAMRLKPESLEI